MLSVTRVSSGQANSYYSKDDYYLESGGQWCGRGAGLLGLSSKVGDEFKQLTQGTAPNNEFQIQSGGKNSEHSAGADLTFSAPKSVSIASLVLDDSRIFEAHEKAVNEALKYIEDNLAQVRLKVNGQVLVEKTNNLLTAKFQHVSSRAQDPQLHTHCVVLNASQKANGDWRAVDYKAIFDNKMLLGQLYRSELAKNLKELGYEIESDNKGFFEIKGIAKDILDEFSTRSKQIAEKLTELREKYPYLPEAKLKEMATLESRENKEEIDMKELKSRWDKQLHDKGIIKQDILKTAQDIPKKKEALDTNKIINIAIKILTETEAVVKREDVLKTALKIGIGDYTIQDFELALDNNKELKNYNNKFYTTLELAGIEQGIIDRVIDGKGQSRVVLDTDIINLEIARYELDSGVKIDSVFRLTDDQKKGIKHILTSSNKVIAIQGDAGTGKTTMLDCVREVLEQSKSDIEIQGLSFTGKASYEITVASQIASSTVATFVNNEDAILSDKSKIIIVDEASMLSIKDLNSILAKCDDNTKLVLLGDTKQLQAIGQGKIFSTLQERGIIDTVHMSESQRQVTAEYKQAVDLLAAKEVQESFLKLDQQHKIIEYTDRDSRLRAITTQYCQKHKDTLIVTPLNKDRKELNTLIREDLKIQGKISSDEVRFIVRESRNLNAEQRSFADSYNIGDLVIANDAKVLGKSGVETRVINIDKINNTITVKSQDQTIYEINLNEKGRGVSVYKDELNHFSVGEKIVFLKNDKGIGVNNGQTAIIKEILPDGKMKLELDKGKELTINPRRQYNYIAHGYAVTDYKAQGQTSQQVIYHADTQGTINYNQAYVGISRGKKDITIYTDDKESLKEMVCQEQTKTSTLDRYDILSKILNANEFDIIPEYKKEILPSRVPESDYEMI